MSQMSLYGTILGTDMPGGAPLSLIQGCSAQCQESGILKCRDFEVYEMLGKSAI